MAGQTLIQGPVPVDGGEVCAGCGRIIGRLEQPFISAESVLCFGCYRHAHERRTTDALPAEHVLFADSRVQVTQRQLNAGNARYNLDAVRFARLRKLPPHRLIPMAIASAGIATSLTAMNLLQQAWNQPLPLAGSAAFVLGLLMALLARGNYQILITDLECERLVLSSRSKRYISCVLAAIAEAIVERGQLSPSPDRE